MEIIGPSSPPLAPAGSVVTIGVYDGVHLGHQRTLRAVVEMAHASDRAAVVATFDRHPASVLRPQAAPKLLADLEQRLELLEQAGLDVTAVIPFDLQRARETAEDFISGVLVDLLGASRVVVGEGFRFGAGRLGDTEVLAAQGRRLGFDIETISLDMEEGEAVSSTRIRGEIAQGDVAGASALLGRCHELRGEVVHGDGRGGPLLGMPTANIHVGEDMAVPELGIYAGWYRDEEISAHPAAISVGRRPTFYADADPLIEAHLIGFSGDLYGRSGRISFLDRLRDEQRFDDLDELIAQMGADVAHAARLLADAAELAPGR